MSSIGPENKYHEEYLKALFDKSSDEILASGVSVEEHIAHNLRKALKDPKAKKVYMSRLSPARKHLTAGRCLPYEGTSSFLSPSASC